jgi:hypothetical protein
VRAPLTQFASLQGEERERIAKLTALMDQLNGLVAELDGAAVA